MRKPLTLQTLFILLALAISGCAGRVDVTRLSAQPYEITKISDVRRVYTIHVVGPDHVIVEKPSGEWSSIKQQVNFVDAEEYQQLQRAVQNLLRCPMPSKRPGIIPPETWIVSSRNPAWRKSYASPHNREPMSRLEQICNQLAQRAAN